MRMRWLLIAVLVLLISPVSVNSPVQAAGGPLTALLAQVPDNDVSRTVIWYGSLGDLERLLGITLKTYDDLGKLNDAQQLAYLGDIGNQVYYSAFLGLDHPVEWQQSYGINTFSVDRELTVGAAEKHYDILQGSFDSGAIKGALQKLGYKSVTVAGVPVFSIGDDYAADPAHPAQANFNRLVVNDKMLVAAPATPLIQAAVSGDKKISADGAYSSLAAILENPDTISGTQLISAVLFSGPFLSDTVITADPLKAAVGDTLPADQLEALRNQLGLANEKFLPRYDVSGIGYRRNETERYWVVAVGYADANAAASANGILADRLGRYGSFAQGGRKLFEGWKIASKVQPGADGKHQFVVVSMHLPAGQTDVSWVKLIAARDLGFLATTH